jgi:hypothetical protein
MVRPATPTTIRALRGVRFVLLAFVTAFVAHDAVFFAHYGLTDAFVTAVRGGVHGAYLPLVGAVAAVAALGLVGAATLRLAWLAGRLRALPAVRPAANAPAPHAPAPHVPGRRTPAGQAASSAPARRTPAAGDAAYRQELIRLWLRLFLVVTVVFAVQENIEHAVHHHGRGLGALWSREYPFALPVLALVTLVAAAVGALVRWRIAILATLVATRTAVARHARSTASRPAVRWWVAAAACLLHWTIARQDPCRAPPCDPLPA